MSPRAADQPLCDDSPRYRALLDASRDAVCVVGLDGRIVDVNAAAACLFGYTREELIGLRSSALCACEKEAHVLLEPTAVDRDMLLRGKDGSTLPAAVRCAPPVDGDRLVIVHDLREYKRFEAQLRHVAKMETVGRLTGGVAHDFNNLLTAIIGYGELLQVDLPAQDPNGRDIREICRAAHTAAALTRQLLAFSRQRPAEPSAQDVHAIVGGVKQLLTRLIGEQIALELTLTGEPVPVMAEECEIQQIVLNLAVNARDAMPLGGRLAILVDTREIDGTDSNAGLALARGRYVRISVADTGHGMDAETERRIFEPFFTTKEATGTGLGLATVHDIVRSRHGAISVASTIGVGTTFEVYLPVAGCLASDRRPIADRDTAPPSCGETILVTEDDAGVLSLISTSLRRRGYQVLEARDPHAALSLVRAHDGPIDLLIADLILPEMNGRMLAEHVLALRPDVKTLYVSGYSKEYVVANLVLEAGSVFLQKPFLPLVLTDKVSEVLRPATNRATTNTKRQ
jgi:PAS domain S-box-containing protein